METAAVYSNGTKPDFANKTGIRLDIGCGHNKIAESWVGMDAQDVPGVDVVHNWNDFPWPFQDESVLQILASHVVEHVNPADGHFLRWMNECWRILVPNGVMGIVAPYAGSHGFWQDPTHCNGVNETTFAYFDPEHPSIGNGLWGFYQPQPWRIRECFWSPVGNIEVIMEKRNDG